MSSPQSDASGLASGADAPSSAPQPERAETDRVLRVAAARFVRRAAWARALGLLLRVTVVASLALGAGVLVARSAWGVAPDSAAWALLLLPLSLGAALLAQRVRGGERLGLEAAAAWLDVRAGGGGQLTTAAEAEDPRWREHHRRILERGPGLPRIRTGRQPLWAGAGLAFLAAAFFVPVPVAAARPEAVVFTAAVDDLSEELETLKEQLELEAELEADLEERLESLRDAAQDARPEGLFEARDRLAEAFASAAEQAQEAARDAAAELAAAENAARGGDPQAAQAALAEALQGLAEAGLAEPALEALAEAAEAAAGAEPSAAGLDPALQEALANLAAGLDPAALESLAEALSSASGGLDPAALEALSGALSEGLAERLAALAEAGLLENGTLLTDAQLASLAELARDLPPPHQHDETCEPGGT